MKILTFGQKTCKTKRKNWSDPNLLTFASVNGSKPKCMHQTCQSSARANLDFYAPVNVFMTFKHTLSMEAVSGFVRKEMEWAEQASGQ